MGDKARARRILAGDKREAAALVVEHQGSVRRMLWYLCGDAAAASDLTRRSFVAAWQALCEYRGGVRLGTWLHRMAYREYARWLSAGHAGSSPAGPAGLPASNAAGLQTVLLSRALWELPEGHRETFLLFHAYGLSIKAIAQVQEVAPSTVSARLSSARAHLRQVLAVAAPVASVETSSPAVDAGGDGSR